MTCAAALILILALTQIPSTYSIELSAPGTNNVDNCSPSNSVFETGLRKLADAATERTDVPSEFIQRYFAGCTIEKIQEFLAENGFVTGDSAPAFGDRAAGITRTVLAERMMQSFGQLVSLNCRIILQIKSSNALDIYGFFISMDPSGAKPMGGKIEVFGRLSLISVLVLTQIPPAYPIEVSTPGASIMNNCNASNEDFGGDLKRLSGTIKRNQDIPQEFLERHFAGCTIENARKLLVKNGFAAEELGPEFDDSEPEKVIPRRIVAAKGIRRIGPLGSLNCRIILQTDTSKRVKAEGFFYFDGP